MKKQVKVKQLTAKQAWLKLAAIWETAKRYKYEYGVKLPKYYGDTNYVAIGICATIQYLRDETKELPGDIARKMFNSIWDYNGDYDIDGGYNWPLNKAGAQQRVVFCRTMALKRR